MKGKILLKALEILYEGTISQADFFSAVLVAGYGAGMSKIDYEYNKRQRERKVCRDREERLRTYISKMRQDGLIIENKNVVTISSKGKNKLDSLRNTLPDRHYEEIPGQKSQIIISFDIPEKLRRKRNWLREVIKNLKFKMIHQSVWMGKLKIPKDFINDLENLKILEYVEIFEISKIGTLKKLT